MRVVTVFNNLVVKQVSLTLETDATSVDDYFAVVLNFAVTSLG